MRIEATNKDLRRLVTNVIQGAVDGAILGNPYDIEWLGSDDAQYYYDVLGMDRNFAIAGFLRNYFKFNKNPKAWIQNKQRLDKENYAQIRMELKHG